MSGHLLPENRRLPRAGHRIEREQPGGGKAGGTMRQVLEGGNKETGYEMHYKTKGDLSGDQRVHVTAPGMWIVPALQRSDRLHRRGAQRRREAEQQSDG